MEAAKGFRSLIVALTIGLAGCASAGKSARTDQPVGPYAPGGASGGSQEYGPPAPQPTDQPSGVYGPEPIQIRPMVVVLGPGLARGFAHVGVIRAMVENKIPIGAVLGTEMGALVGAVYAMEGNVNAFEFGMQRFKNDAFVASKSLLPNPFERTRSGKRLEADAAKVFGKKDLNQSKIPLKVSVQLKESGQIEVLDRGPVAAAVRAAIANPEILEPGTWNGEPAMAAMSSRPFLVTEARAMNLGPVVVIDVAGESSSELKDADLVIRPDLDGINPTDFQKRTEIAFKGKKSALGYIAQLRHLAGIPSEPEAQKGSQ